MVNVLLNYYNFHEDWAYKNLSPYIRPECKVTIVPYAYRDYEVACDADWQKLYGPDGEKYPNIIAPFLAYGISEKNIKWVNFFTDDGESSRRKISSADILLFTGGLPEKITQRLLEKGITDAVKNFKGVLMGVSAGAMFQLERYHITPDEDYDSYGIYHGIGLLDGFDLEVHYTHLEIQQQCTQRALKELKLPVYAMYHCGGLLIADGHITVMGDVDIHINKERG